MVIIPFPIFYPEYTKKEDAKKMLRQGRKGSAFTSLGAIVVLAIHQLWWVPKMMKLYGESKVPLPLITQISPYVIGVSIVFFAIVAIYLLVTPPNYERLDKISRQYKDGEMIRTKQVIGSYEILAWFIAGLGGLVVGFVTYANLVPIFNFTTLYK